jgi:hypothetical protein
VIVIVMIVLVLVAGAAFIGVVLLDEEPAPGCDGSGSGRGACSACRDPARTCDLCEGRTDACAPEEGWPVARYSMPEHNGVDAYPVETWLCQPCAYMTAEALSEHAAGVAALEREPTCEDGLHVVPPPTGTGR